MSKKSVWKDHRGNDCRRREDGTIEVTISFADDPGLTEQSHTKECDLNYIVSQYVRSDIPIALQEAEFRDMTQMVDYQTAFNAVESVNKLFRSFSIEVKRAFNHDPAAFAAAMHDPSKKDMLIEMGILEAVKTAPKGQSGAPSNPSGAKEPPQAEGTKTPEKG